MKSRLFTGVVLAIVVSLVVLKLEAHWIKILVVILGALAAWEASVMFSSQGLKRADQIFNVFLISGLLASLLFLKPTWSFFVMALLWMLLFVRQMVGLPQELKEILPRFLTSAFIVFFFGLLFSYLGFLRELPQGHAWLFLTLATTFASDTGAYFAGKFLGSHKLAPRLSPNKTIEGWVGGIILSVIAAFICNYLFFNKIFEIKDLVFVGVLAGALGPLGDLAESLMKRAVGVKDSGILLPGHGGLWDRVDALLFTAPLVYLYASLSLPGSF